MRHCTINEQWAAAIVEVGSRSIWGHGLWLLSFSPIGLPMLIVVTGIISSCLWASSTLPLLHLVLWSWSTALPRHTLYSMPDVLTCWFTLQLQAALQACEPMDLLSILSACGAFLLQASLRIWRAIPTSGRRRSLLSATPCSMQWRQGRSRSDQMLRRGKPHTIAASRTEVEVARQKLVWRSVWRVSSRRDSTSHPKQNSGERSWSGPTQVIDAKPLSSRRAPGKRLAAIPARATSLVERVYRAS